MLKLNRLYFLEQRTNNYLVEANKMKWDFHKNKKMVLSVFIIILFIAGLLDLKYEGLVYQLLPSSVQSYIDGML